MNETTPIYHAGNWPETPSPTAAPSDTAAGSGASYSSESKTRGWLVAGAERWLTDPQRRRVAGLIDAEIGRLFVQIEAEIEGCEANARETRGADRAYWAGRASNIGAMLRDLRAKYAPSH